MVISKRQQVIMFFIWLIVVPPGFIVAYTYFPSRELDWLNLVILFIILFLTMLMPIRFQNVTISLERWVSFVIFFQYGVFAELIFIQLAMLILLFSDKSSLPISHKFFVNSSMFTTVSIGSGMIFHFAGGTIGSLDFSNIFMFGLLYATTYTILNNVLLKVYFYFNSRSYSLFAKGAKWDYIATMIMLPLSISLYFLQVHLGNKSFLLVGIPFLIVMLVIQMYNNSNNLNNQLSFASDIGHELADRLRYDEVIQMFIEKLKDVVPYDNAYVVDLRGGENLIPLMGFENESIVKQVEGIVFRKNNANDGLDSNTSRIYGNRKEVRALKSIEIMYPVESVMTAPIKRNQKTEGFLILTSRQKNIFRKVEMKIIDVLTGYFAISLEKARYYENTVEKSERCGLTKLHNYRYLESKLDEEVAQFHAGEIASISTIILDIDHFKQINDTYGHQSANDLLVGLARLLETYVLKGATLARYGGEEFVIVLPGSSKSEAVEFAEIIRKEIENTSFSIVPDLSENRIPIEVCMTVSLGVANIPEDSNDVKDLMRNADRALYIGGKQAGRNRVGVYGEEEIVSVL